MSFKSIRREEFDRFLPPPLVLGRLITERVDWFANTAGNIIGTIAGKADEGWSYAALKGDPRGNYRICSLGGETCSFDAARTRFLKDMEAAEKAEEELARLEKRKVMTNRRP